MIVQTTQDYTTKLRLKNNFTDYGMKYLTFVLFFCSKCFIVFSNHSSQKYHKPGSCSKTLPTFTKLHGYQKTKGRVFLGTTFLSSKGRTKIRKVQNLTKLSKVILSKFEAYSICYIIWFRLLSNMFQLHQFDKMKVKFLKKMRSRF